MKALNKLACLLPVTLLSISIQAQVHITQGLKVTASGPLQLIFSDAPLIHDGDFVPGTGNVLFTGQHATSYIGGTRPVSFYNLIVDKTGQRLSLHTNIRVVRELAMVNGDLQVNDRAVDLGYTGYISGERNESRIYGGEYGTIKAMAILHAPRGANPGNMGVEISSPAVLGETTIIRGYSSGITSDGRTVTQRYYDIRPAQNNNLHAALKFHYLDIELAGKKSDESRLSLFTAGKTGHTWVPAGKDEMDIAANWIIKTGLSELHRYTIADDAIKDQRQYYSANLRLFPNPTTGRFTVTVNIPQEKQVLFNLYDGLGRLLESRLFQCRKGLNILSWDIEKYVAGSYFLSMQNGERSMLTVVKQ